MRSEAIQFVSGKQAKLIERAIAKAGSTEQLAFLTGIPRRTIRHYKTESFCIPRSRLDQVLSVLDTTFKDIATDVQCIKHPYWGQALGGNNSCRKISDEELMLRMSNVRKHKRTIQKIAAIPFTAEFCEFFGILMGDGCISRYTDYEKTQRYDIVVSGDKRYEEPYYMYIQSLLRKFGVHAYVKKSSANNSINIVIRNKPFALFLLAIGFPQGKKYGHLRIPKVLLELEWDKFKFLIRGLFDTDGTIFAKKNEKYRYPYVGISAKDMTLLQNLQDILRRKDYPVYINSGNLLPKGIRNVKEWMADIGSSNSKHIFKYQYWQTHGNLPARLWAGS